MKRERDVERKMERRKKWVGRTLSKLRGRENGIVKVKCMHENRVTAYVFPPVI